MSPKKKGGKPKISYRELMSKADGDSKVEKPAEAVPVAQSPAEVKATKKKTTEAREATDATETPAVQKAPEPVQSSATFAPSVVCFFPPPGWSSPPEFLAWQVFRTATSAPDS